MRLAELVGTLSLATDAATGVPEEAGLRSAIVATKLAELVGASPTERAEAYWLTLLRYSGCTADGDLAAEVFGDEIEFGRETQGMDYGNPREVVPAVMRRARRGKGAIGGAVAMAATFGKMISMRSVMRSHCEVADLLAARLGFDASLRAALVQHAERWDGSGMPAKRKGEAIARSMRIAHAAAEVEIGHRLGGLDGARARVAKLRGRNLDPDIAARFDASARDVCAAIEVPSIWNASIAAEPLPHRELAPERTLDGLEAIAAFADLKSKFTRGHSIAVAKLATAAARAIGLPAEVVSDVQRAALLHDLGRVAISAGIWDKATPLTDVEREKIRLHTYVGERVLMRAPALRSAAELACLAHERLDGTGYHRRLSALACPPAARLLAAADVYCALIEERPHRRAFDGERAVSELRKMADAGSLCPDAVNAVVEAAGHDVKPTPRAAGLTDREVEVLRLLARGLTNKEIATSLSISTKTAGHHVQHIFEKLGVTTRAAAAMCAMSKGITA